MEPEFFSAFWVVFMISSLPGVCFWKRLSFTVAACYSCLSLLLITVISMDGSIAPCRTSELETLFYWLIIFMKIAKTESIRFYFLSCCTEHLARFSDPDNTRVYTSEALVSILMLYLSFTSCCICLFYSHIDFFAYREWEQHLINILALTQQDFLTNVTHTDLHLFLYWSMW